MKNSLVFFLLLLFSYAATAQEVEFKKDNFKEKKDQFKDALKQLEEGNKIYEDETRGPGRYRMALEKFLKAQAFNPEYSLLNYRIGVCYLHSSQKTNAIPYLEKSLKLNPTVDSKIHYMLGRAYHLNEEWDRAIQSFIKYKNTLSPEAWKLEAKDVTKKIEECNTGKELVKKPVRVFIDNVGSGINTADPEYGAVISADESVMMFTSRRATTTGGGMDPGLGEYYEDIYISYKVNGKWQQAVNMGEPINTNEHDATVSLTADGQKMYIYKGDEGGDIFECYLKGASWSKPERLGKTINTKHHEPSASLSYDGKRIYFVSSKPAGSYGGSDIYYSELDKKGRWGEPVNLGPGINTPYEEEAVFMHPDGKTMYFSSQGHKTMGGYDIFKCTWNDSTKSWSEPENMGYPINTPDDDVFFVLSASGKHAYYASVRADGYGEKDIYRMTILGPEKPPMLNTEDNLLASVTAPVKEKQIEPVMAIKTAQLTILKGTIKDAISLDPVEATIELTDNSKNEVIATFTSNSKTGKYLVSLPAGKNYGIAVRADKYLFHSENFDIPAIAAYQEITKDILLKKIEVGQSIILKNIFFDFDKATLRPESTAELERLIALLNEFPTLRIEISGHTDGKGSANYNQVLSESRAKSVVEYLVKKGIDRSRLEFKGYGLSMPIATNDTEEGRQLNRRTEFKVLSK